MHGRVEVWSRSRHRDDVYITSAPALDLRHQQQPVLLARRPRHRKWVTRGQPQRPPLRVRAPGTLNRILRTASQFRHKTVRDGRESSLHGITG
jgi:hypothetical protein